MKKKFSIPVIWEMLDKVDVEAENIEEAIQWLKDNIDEVPLGTKPEYVDGSHKIYDGDNGENSIEKTINYLKEYWNYNGEIDGEEIY